MSKQKHTVSAEVADWNRETPHNFADASRKLLRAIRRYQHWRKRGGVLAKIVCPLIQLRHKFWSVITGADIPLQCKIGGGLLIPHPNGIVIHPGATIGVNCLIFQQVTIGMVECDRAPVIGGHVDIGAGAKILGDITVGAHARIGANAVVLADVPEGAVAVGVPARIVDRS